MQQTNSPSYFMLWLHEQNQPISFKNTILSPQVSEKNIESPLTQDNSSEKSSVKIHDSNDKSDTQSIKQSKKNFITFRDEKDPDFNLKKQKKNRNVLSNLVHHLMKYLANRPQTEQYVSQVIKHNHMTMQIDQFYNMLEELTNILKSYVTQKSLMALWLGELTSSTKNSKTLTSEFAKLIRILSRKFYKQTCRSSVFFSNKLSLESKELHYQGLHEIYELLYMLDKAKGREDKKSKKKM